MNWTCAHQNIRPDKRWEMDNWHSKECVDAFVVPYVSGTPSDFTYKLLQEILNETLFSVDSEQVKV